MKKPFIFNFQAIVNVYNDFTESKSPTISNSSSKPLASSSDEEDSFHNRVWVRAEANNDDAHTVTITWVNRRKVKKGTSMVVGLNYIKVPNVLQEIH